MKTITSKQYREMIGNEQSKSKYGNKKTIVDDILFDSKKEAIRYSELKLMEKYGQIYSLELQKPFILLESFEYQGQKIRGITYVSDFYYLNERGEEIVEDSKGVKSDMFKIKEKFFKNKYPNIKFILS